MRLKPGRSLAILACCGMMALIATAEDKPAAKGEKVRIGPVNYQVPSTWQRQRGSNNMRVAQFGIPLQDRDKGKAELVVFYFGGQGGGVEDNIKRWVGMFQDKDGKEKVEKFNAGDLKITTLDVSGSYKDKPFPMAQEFTLRENYRMLAAVVETPDDGPFFFRLVGPKKTISANAEAFTQMLKTAGKDG